MLLLLVGCAAVIELGWVICWPLSYTLSNGSEYTITLLNDLPFLGPPLDRAIGLSYVAALALLQRLPPRPGLSCLVWGATILFDLTLLGMPGVLTTDIFSYTLYGRISFLYRLNPYTTVPAAFPNDPVLPWMNTIWLDQPSVYGPLWTDVGWLMTRIGLAFDLTGQVFAYKVLMLLVHLGSLGVVWWLIPRIGVISAPSARLVAFATFAWNPLVLFEVVGNAHNDGLMLLLLLLALVPLAA